MKIGKVIARIQASPKVKSMNITSDNEVGSLYLEKGWYVPGADQAQFCRFTTAGQADRFVRSAVKVPEGKMVSRNAMTGKSFLEDENSDYYTSPRSETYWCS